MKNRPQMSMNLPIECLKYAEGELFDVVADILMPAIGVKLYLSLIQL